MQITIQHPEASYQELLTGVAEKSVPQSAPQNLPPNPTQPQESPTQPESPAEPDFVELTEVVPEILSPPAAALPQGALPPTFDAAREIEDIPELFDRSLHELKSETTEDSIELGLSELHQLERSEHLDLLFDLAIDVLKRPELETELTDQVDQSTGRVLVAKEIDSALTQMERTASSTSLRLTPHPTKSSSSAQAAKGASPEPSAMFFRNPPLQLRAFAVAIDLAFVIGAAFVLRWVYLSFFDPNYAALLSGIIKSTKPLDFLPLQALAVGLGVISLPIYMTLSLLFFRATIGTKLTKIAVVKENGHALSQANSIVRGLTFPLSVFCLGFFPLLRGRRAVHDVLASTTVVQASAQKSPF